MRSAKYPLFLFSTVLLWADANNARATCWLTSALASVSTTQNFTFPANSNGTKASQEPIVPFWSGSPDETYSCPRSTQELWLDTTDDLLVEGGSGTVFGPGIMGGINISNGSIFYNGFNVTTEGTFPASGKVPSAFLPWKYVGVRLVISDSTQARNITIYNKIAGYVFLTTEEYYHQRISGDPLTKVFVSGKITIPASCQLESGSVVFMPDTLSGEYGKAGAGGKIGTGISQPLTIRCLGGSDSATIDLHVTTNKAAGDDIVTTNPDVGVRVLDANHQTVSAKGGQISVSLDNGNVKVPLTYVPVAITGKNPKPGSYSAIETIIATLP